MGFRSTVPAFGKKVIIEARVNEYMPRDVNPNVPFTPDEIVEAAVACREAGAAICHYHARNPDGSPNHDPETYIETIRKLRAASDILINPTLGQVTLKSSDEARLQHIVSASREPGLTPDFAPIDIGSTNVDVYDPAAKTMRTDTLAYVNTPKTCAYFARRMREVGVKPVAVSWTIPFTRMFEAFLEMGLLDQPAYLLFALSDSGYLGGHPGTIKGLLSHLEYLPQGFRYEWSVNSKVGNLFGPAALALEMGGHVAIGLGDYPYPELGTPTNADLVRRIAEHAEAFGRAPASPAETRALLGMS
ncbi:MAG: 3-keto-5-aminohexanoate cleavage protein [Thalassobaculaceae bacterium]|nr:3-keto-5-aminohexanoate cleavage protein [Thalassobaculaceae bacterium]